MLVRCDRCGAPLDVKPSQRMVTCSYCRGSIRLNGTQTMAAVTPPNWTPPPTWTPPPHISPTPLSYSPVARVLRFHLLFSLATTLGIGVVVAVGVLRSGASRSGPLPSPPTQLEPEGAPSMVESRSPTATPIANRIAPDSPPTLGVIDLDTAPDNATLSGVAGGPLDAHTLGGRCRGWIPSAPHAVLTTTSPRYVLATTSSGPDLTMVFRGPSGEVRCDNDTGYNRNPLIAGPFPPGTYEVWIGTRSSGDTTPFTLQLSSEPIDSATVENGFTPQSPLTLGILDATRLSRPYTRSGTVTGRSDARGYFSRCLGALTPEPQLTLTTSTTRRLRIEVRSSRDTTLFVREGHGGVMCNDGSRGGLSPRLERDFWPGTFQVWVATSRPGNTADFRLTVSAADGR